MIDILNLLKFKPEPIEYYQKYSLKTTIVIAIFISVVFGLFPPPLPSEVEVSFFAHFLMMLMMVPILLAVTWFLSKLLKLKHKKPSFQALFALTILAGIIDLLFIPLAFLAQLHSIFDYLQLVVLGYSLLVFLFAFVKANEISLSFGLLAILLGTVVLIILMIVVNVIFITFGLIPAPTLPPA